MRWGIRDCFLDWMKNPNNSSFSLLERMVKNWNNLVKKPKKIGTGEDSKKKRLEVTGKRKRGKKEDTYVEFTDLFTHEIQDNLFDSIGVLFSMHL